jgi:hypothetical protein
MRNQVSGSLMLRWEQRRGRQTLGDGHHSLSLVLPWMMLKAVEETRRHFRLPDGTTFDFVGILM